jgi:phosphoribosylglycinamide formyltransferase-1
MLNVGVLVSGGGTNLQAIIDKIDSGYITKARIAVVIASKPDAYALERARKHGIAAEIIDRKRFETLDLFDAEIIRILNAYEVGLVVMGGFNYILGESFVNAFRDRIINVHPALVPSFCGKGFYKMVPHEKALEYGVKLTGATVHFVELDCDAGPIISQKAIPVRNDDTPETLQKRVMEECEWVLLPEAVKLISEGKVRKEGRIVKVMDENGQGAKS